MTRYSHDPRIIFREGIGLQRDVYKDGNFEYCLVVKDSSYCDIDIPIYLSEEIQSENLPIFPYAYLNIMNVSYTPDDIGGVTRKMEAWIDVHIYYTDVDNINKKIFGKNIKDTLYVLVKAYQSSLSGIDFMNIEDDRYERETDGRQVVYHYIASLYILYNDFC